MICKRELGQTEIWHSLLLVLPVLFYAQVIHFDIVIVISFKVSDNLVSLIPINAFYAICRESYCNYPICNVD